MTEEFSNETDKIEKLLDNNNESFSEESKNVFNEQFKKLEKEIQKTQRKESYILDKLKLKSYPIRINEDLDIFIDSIHRTLLKKGLVDDKYKAIKKYDLLSKVIGCSNNFHNPYFEWVILYNDFRSKVMKYNYQSTFPTVEVIKGKTQSRSFYLYENDIEILSNFSKKIHVYNITNGDLLMILVAEFIRTEKYLIEYNDLSQQVLSKWKEFELILPMIFYATNLKIAEDVQKNYDYSSINVILKYIDSIIDFTNNEILKCEHKEYVNSLCLSYIRDLYEKFKASISKIDEKKEAISIITCGEFNVIMLEEIKKKLELYNKLYNR